MPKRLINFIFLLSTLTLLLFSTNAHSKIKLQLDRNDIRVNETFLLTLNVEDPKTLSVNQGMNFLPAEFQLLGSQNFQKSTVVNRQFANSMGWNLTLLANQAGTYTMPQFTIGNEQSEPFTIRILPAVANIDELNPNSKVKLTAQISSDKVYVQQQIIYSVRVYSSVPSRRHSLSPLQVENAIVKKLGEASEFEMVSKGTQYNVKEQKYLIFPQKSGEISIPPILYRTNIVDTQASYGSLSRYRPIELKSKPFKVEVTPRPENVSLPWLPAKDLTLTAQWQSSTQDFEVGKPATLDFYIKGVGLLPEQLPEIEFPEVNGLKIYRDKPVLQSRVGASGVTSYHLEKLAVIPNQSGQITIPAVKIGFWNTTTDSQDYAELQPITIDIAETQAVTALPAVSQQSIEPAATLPTTVIKENPLWQYLTAAFAALWLITLGLYFLKKSNKSAQPITEPGETIPEQAQQQISLKQASSSSDPHQVAQAAIQWADARSHIKITNLNQLINHSPNPELKVELTNLQAALYSNDAKSDKWSGTKIYQLLTKVDFNSSNKSDSDQLPPLYP